MRLSADSCLKQLVYGGAIRRVTADFVIEIKQLDNAELASSWSRLGRVRERRSLFGKAKHYRGGKTAQQRAVDQLNETPRIRVSEKCKVFTALTVRTT